eukprot:3204133-Prymnesium_polylepis.1
MAHETYDSALCTYHFGGRSDGCGMCLYVRCVGFYITSIFNTPLYVYVRCPCVCVLRVYGAADANVCVCYGSTGRGPHGRGTRRGRATPKQTRRGHARSSTHRTHQAS